MERIRNIKHRLSLSVDKLSQPVNDKLPDTEVLEGEVSQSVDGGINNSSKEKRARPSSWIEGSSFDGATTLSEITSYKLQQKQINSGNKDHFELSDKSIDSFGGFSDILSSAQPTSLMEEVMSEVEKLSKLTADTSEVGLSRETQLTTEKQSPCSTVRPTVKQEPDSMDESSSENSSLKITETSDFLSGPTEESTTTSGYFSDSASENIMRSDQKIRDARSKTISPIPKIFRVSRFDKTNKTVASSTTSSNQHEEEEKPKKESIYSRLLKSAKRDGSTSRPAKEPIYARIRPKIKSELNFKPIEPNLSENSSGNTGIVKPEPIYSKVKQKDLKSTISAPLALGKISPSSPSSSFSPISTSPKNDDFSPIYSKSKAEKAKSFPFQPLYGNAKTKAVDTSNMDSTSKQPIYNQPLPALPNEEIGSPDVSVASSRESTLGFYGRVKVRTKEILPCKASVITITNPGYAKPSICSPPRNKKRPPISKKMTPRINETTKDNSKSSLTPAKEEKEFSVPLDHNLEDKIQTSISSVGTDLENSFDFNEKSRLSRLVEELAQELESVTRRTGLTDAADDKSKKEVLTKLLSAYDVPKNLRRVEEADDEAVIQAERSLIPPSVSPDELRFVDDNDETMIYGDVPDYSQDEFVIALDDENDPKYASLTRDLRYKRTGGESPGKVSRKSAQVYVNVVNVLSALKVLINSNSTKAATVINKMGTIAKPYAQKVQTSINDTQWMQRKFHKTGHNGFDELRRYIKSGGEFCKELAVIMHERAELESTYAKGLHKLSTKLVKASREALGTVSEAWQAVGMELEHEGDMHRILSASLTEDVVRPLRQLIETQHKIRKGVESIVDKATKNLQDWRAAETKAKKTSFHNNRENEKVQDMVIDARLGRGKILSDKDLLKMEKQKRKAEDAVHKSDLEYYSFCVRTERARQEWESAVYKGSNCFQTLEEERLESLKNLLVKYYTNLKDAAPKFVASTGRLDEPIENCDVEKDIQTVIAAKGTGENAPEQNLPDFYSEDTNTAMNKARRRESLEKFIKLMRADLDRERRGKQGVENLAKALQETPNFGGEDSQQDVYDKLQHMKAMLAYLEASRYKVQNTLDELNNRPPSAHPLAKHIETQRDKQGMMYTILKVPPWVKGNCASDISPLTESPDSSPNWNDRGTADGNSVQPDSDFDEFSSQGSDQDYQNTLNDRTSKHIIPGTISIHNTDDLASSEDQLDSGTGSAPDGTYYARPLTAVPASGRCKALYDYEANMYDELSIKTGDIINIHEKQPDGWWIGELDGIVGIFPATYVEEIDFTN